MAAKGKGKADAPAAPPVPKTELEEVQLRSNQVTDEVFDLYLVF